MNQITLLFNECSPLPSKGYNVLWRVAGSGDPYTNAGNFFLSPAVFFDDSANPPDTVYEGIIRAEINNGFCDNVFWTTAESGIQESGGGGSGYILTLDNPCNGITGSYTLSGGTAGDIVVVRATFSGLIQNVSGFTRANLTITSPNGTTDNDESACYTDTSMHGFTITAETTIVMPGGTAALSTSAVIHNSILTAALTLEIVSVNGIPDGYQLPGCRGNSSTGGTC